MRLLFVDDDRRLLNGLKRLLKVERPDWECHYCVSAQEGLDLVERHDVDIVVSDMRMPEMDGIAFFERLRDLCPTPVRIIMSGQTGECDAGRVAKAAHQFIPKPCLPANLINILERIFRFREFFTDNGLRGLVNKIGTLPVLPAVYQQLMCSIDDKGSSLMEISSIVGKDPALVADILKTVNSAFLGARQPVNDIGRAVTMLGLETIQGLVLCHGLLRQFKRKKVSEFSLSLLWDHALRVAAMAKKVAVFEGLDKEETNSVVLAGLMHDLGKLVLLDGLPEEYSKVLYYVREEGKSVTKAERAVFGSDHSKLGAYLLGLWGNRDDLVYTVACHHSPLNYPQPLKKGLSIIHVVNVLDHDLLQFKSYDAPHDLDHDFIAQNQLGDAIKQWKAICKEEIARMVT